MSERTLSDGSSPEIEFVRQPDEAVFLIQGRAAEAVGRALFGARLVPGALASLAWLEEAPPAAVAWLPPGRLEIRIPAAPPWPDRLAARLAELTRSAQPDAWDQRLAAAIARLEAWGDSETDPGGGIEELAAELEALAEAARSRSARQAIRSAREALDDGLPLETVAAALYRARMS